jgi:transcriptional regulator with XRE-family HTH domain
MVTIGQKLGEARREAGLSVEAIAHDTRIHPNMIRLIEEDDFSIFPSVAYARSFVNKYAGVLGIDLSDSMRALNSGVTLQLGDHELMGEMKNTIKKDRRFKLERIPRWARKPRFRLSGRPLLLNFILVALIGAMAVFYFLGFNAPNSQQAQENISRGLQGANPFSESPEEEIPEFPLGKDEPDLVANPATPGNATILKPRLTYVDGGIEKPEVTLEMEDPRPLPAEAIREKETQTPALRRTPSLSVDSAMPGDPISTSDLPALTKPSEEPNAVLRPEGTNPVVGPAPEPNPSDAPIRAIPVAESR